MTPRRRMILEELTKSHDHLTADEVFHRVRKRLPGVSLGTIYRNLELLARAGHLNVINGTTQRRYDTRQDFHYHIKCINCDWIIDAPVEPDAAIEDMVREKTDFPIVGHNIEFLAICPKCKDKEEKNGQP